MNEQTESTDYASAADRRIDDVIDLHRKSQATCWFSCGAASAVAAKLCLEKHPTARIVYCDLRSDEHPDQQRFLDDVQNWLGVEIQVIASEQYKSVDDVFVDRRYMSGIKGAPCTVAMKKSPRFRIQNARGVNVFGFTHEERNRAARFEENNPETRVEWVLIDAGITKPDCLRMLTDEGIELPTMYRMGYRNNNCLGCVKATSAKYWNMIRRDFPDVFEKRAKQSRELNVRLTRVRGVRCFLDELPADYLGAEPLENISCGPDCSPQMELAFDG